MINFFHKIISSVLLIVGIHTTSSVTEVVPSPVPVTQTDTTTKDAVTAEPNISMPLTKPAAAPSKKPVVSSTPVTTQQVQASIPVSTTPQLTADQIRVNAEMAAQAAFAQKQRDDEAAARSAALEAAGKARDAAVLQSQAENTTVYKLNQINKQIADLNAKYAADKISAGKNTDGALVDQVSAMQDSLYSAYLDKYNELVAEYQQIQYSN